MAMFFSHTPSRLPLQNTGTGSILPDQTLGHAHHEGVHNRGAADSGQRPDRLGYARHLHDGVTERSAVVDHDVGQLVELLARCRPGRHLVRVSERRQRDHRDPPAVRLNGHFHRHAVAAEFEI